MLHNPLLFNDRFLILLMTFRNTPQAIIFTMGLIDRVYIFIIILQTTTRDFYLFFKVVVQPIWCFIGNYNHQVYFRSVYF